MRVLFSMDIEKILKEFSERFGSWKDPFLYPEVYPWLKEKLTQLQEVPMGVSQWKEYGQKYGYWDFFKEEVLEEKIKLPEEIKIDKNNLKNIDYVTYLIGFNQCLEEIKKLNNL